MALLHDTKLVWRSSRRGGDEQEDPAAAVAGIVIGALWGAVFWILIWS